MVASRWGLAHVSKTSSHASPRKPPTAICQEVLVAKPSERLRDRHGLSLVGSSGKEVGLRHVLPLPASLSSARVLETWQCLCRQSKSSVPLCL